jgi:hypothetical protein
MRCVLKVGDGEDAETVETLLVTYALLDAPGRLEWWKEYVRKGKRRAYDDGFMEKYHDTPPASASLLSVPDVFRYAFRILLAVAPKQYNPQRPLSMWWVAPKSDSSRGLNGDLRNWLRTNTPPCIARDGHLTPYGPRCLLACNIVDMGLLGTDRTAKLLRGDFGHVEGSDVIRNVYGRRDNEARCVLCRGCAACAAAAATAKLKKRAGKAKARRAKRAKRDDVE